MNKTNNVAILILTGIAALTIAIGIGRFSYTPILPYMISELKLTTTDAGLIASSNYLGYLLGSLIPIFPQFPKNIRSIFIYSIFISIISLFAMGLTNTFEVFILIRFIHGIFSAFVLILGTSLIVSHVQKKGKIFLGTAHFSGVGLGMALSAIVVSYLGFLNFTWDELWFSIGILAIILSFQIIKFTPIQKAEVKYNLKSKNKTSLGFSLITSSTIFSISLGSLCCFNPFSSIMLFGSLLSFAIISKTVFAILPEIVPSLIKLIKDDKFLDEIGLCDISKFLSLSNANNSPVIQFVASLISEFLITSSKYFDVSISDTNIFASYGVNLNLSTNLFFFSSGSSGISFFIFDMKSSVNSSGNKSGSGKYL